MRDADRNIIFDCAVNLANTITEQCDALVELCDYIDSGNVNRLLKVFKPYENEKLPPGILNFYTYVQNHKDCMDYPLYKQKGYFVGSGAIESGNIRLMQNRMKLQGMRWKLSNGQCMLSLKAKYEAGKWNEVESLMQQHCYPEL
jgi:hypothetical protein